LRKALFLAVLGLFAVLMISSVSPAIGAYRMPNMADKIQQISLTRKPAPVTCEITDPYNGQTITEYGIYRILVHAESTAGIKTVTLKLEGVTYDITSNWDGSHYFYDWDITSDEDYVLNAKAISNQNKRASDSVTVHVSTGTQPPGKYAVVIGISNYDGRDSDLWNPHRDAAEMKEILLENSYSEANILFITNRQATAANIVNAIDWLIAAEGSEDEVVFFYSGHGFRVHDNEGWDSDIESDSHDEGIVTYDFYGLPDGWLAEKFAQLESTKVAMIFCSCHSGGMFDDNDDVGIYGTGRVIVSACKADQYGWDYRLLRNTLFFYYWGDQGLLQDNANSVESALIYAYPLVVAEQPDSQPQIQDDYPGDFTL
jgi:hypothetical protein